MIHQRPLDFWKGLLIGVLAGYALYAPPPLITLLADKAAWPFALVLLLCLFKSQIQELIDRIEIAEWKNIKLQLRQSIAKVSEAQLSSPEPGLSGGPIASATDETASELRRLAVIAPLVAIIESWSAVEESARLLASRMQDESINDVRSPHMIERWLRDKGLLSPEAITVFSELRNLRNIAVHAQPSQKRLIEYTDAMKAINAAIALTEVLDSKEV